MILLTIGIGHGLLFSGLRNVGQAVSDATDAAHAATMFVFLRVLGNALGVAMGAALLQNQLSHHLAALGLDPEIAANAAGYAMSELPLLPAGSKMKEDTIMAYQESMKNLFEFATAVAALVFVLVVFIKKLDLNKQQVSKYQLKDRKVASTAAPNEGVELQDVISAA